MNSKKHKQSLKHFFNFPKHFLYLCSKNLKTGTFFKFQTNFESMNIIWNSPSIFRSIEKKLYGLVWRIHDVKLFEFQQVMHFLEFFLVKKRLINGRTCHNMHTVSEVDAKFERLSTPNACRDTFSYLFAFFHSEKFRKCRTCRKPKQLGIMPWIGHARP